ncbi:hypothetical protein BDW66DRAFT_145735 [Aspergillus desertorum]
MVRRIAATVALSGSVNLLFHCHESCGISTAGSTAKSSPAPSFSRGVPSVSGPCRDQ